LRLEKYASRGEMGKYESSKEVVELSPILNFLNAKLPQEIENAPADPNFAQEIIEKAVKAKKFYGASQMVTGMLQEELPWCAISSSM
jgi:hypothetical protein